MLTIKTVEVAVIVQGNYLQLIDQRGCNIRRIKGELIGMPEMLTIEKMNWHHVIEKQTTRLNSSLFRSNFEPWFKRADAMSCSLRLRRKDRTPKGGRKQLDKWKTITWKEAALRMVEQAYNNSRQYIRSPWVRWATQVSKNQQKRVESRYGKINNSKSNT